MTQLNLHVTPRFEKDLRQLMKVKHLKTKAETIRMAVKETLVHTIQHLRADDFSKWVGLAKQQPLNPKQRFRSDKDLWE